MKVTTNRIFGAYHQEKKITFSAIEFLKYI